MLHARTTVAACVAAGLAVLAPPALAAGGELDPSWAVGGRYVVTASAPDASVQGTRLAPHGDGVLVAATQESYDPVTSASDADLLVRRLDARGVPDPSFGGAGTAVVDLGVSAYLRDVAVLPDGRVLLLTVVSPQGFDDYQIGLVRLLPDGRPDASFGTDGVALTDVRSLALNPRAVLALPDGSALVGLDQDGRGTSDFAVARYDAAGQLDLSYGTAGIRRTDLGGDDHLVELLSGPGGEVFAVGASAGRAGAQAAVAQLRADGSLDTSFGRRGTVKASPRGASVFPSSAALTPHGLVLAGTATDDRTQGQAAHLTALTLQGRLDTGFGNRGHLLLDDAATAEGASVAASADGRLLVSRRLGDGPFLAALEHRTAATGALVEGSGARVELGEAAVSDVRLDGDGLLVAATEFAPEGPVSTVQRRR